MKTRASNSNIPQALMAMIDIAPEKQLMKLGAALENVPEGAKVGIGIFDSDEEFIVDAGEMMLAINAELMTRITVALVGSEDQAERARQIASMPDSMVVVLAGTLNEYVGDPTNASDDGPEISKAIAGVAALANAEMAQRGLASTSTMEA